MVRRIRRATRPKAKKRHPDCTCGTGTYCRYHTAYGLEERPSKLTVPRATMHLVPDESAGGRAGGGIHIHKKGVSGP